MIRGFKDRETEKLFHRELTRKMPPDVQKVALRKLRMLHRAKNLDDLRAPPGNKLEYLKGKREGQLSIRVNDQWRICFIWRNGDVFDVEITDYH